MAAKTQFNLTERDIPTIWYNLAADLPFRVPTPLHPQTLEPIRGEDLEPIFAPSLIEQEMSLARTIDIPGPVLDVYRRWRPTPLRRAVYLEQALGTPARVYYKYEGTSPSGSHKTNTAVAQAYYDHRDGIRRLTTETGAGQWGSALAFACSLYDLDCTVYMVRASYEQKPYRRIFMNAYGATVRPSPSPHTSAGRRCLEQDPTSPGSLGMAISEAVEEAVGDETARYVLGSVLNHVLIHQSIIGLEARDQMALACERPDYVVGCFGGGSNFAGLAFPFLDPAYHGGQPPTCIAVEPTACPTLTRGTYAYDYGDACQAAPVIKMYTLGHEFVPNPIHAGGLRYHGAAPLASALLEHDMIAPRAVGQVSAFSAALLFAKTEGIIPAPESAHAIRGAIDLALEARERGDDPVILFCLSGHGHFDLAAYDAYLAGDLPSCETPAERIAESLSRLPSCGGTRR